MSKAGLNTIISRKEEWACSVQRK